LEANAGANRNGCGGAGRAQPQRSGAAATLNRLDFRCR